MKKTYTTPDMLKIEIETHDIMDGSGESTTILDVIATNGVAQGFDDGMSAGLGDFK